MGGEIPNLIVASIKGQSYHEMKLVVEFQHLKNNDEWTTKKQIFSREFYNLYESPNLFNNEIITYNTHFTDMHPKNQIVGLFGQQFIALDWSESAKNILVFETFKEYSERIEVMASTSDNTHMLLYSGDQHILTHVHRDKKSYDQE